MNPHYINIFEFRSNGLGTAIETAGDPTPSLWAAADEAYGSGDGYTYLQTIEYDGDGISDEVKIRRFDLDGTFDEMRREDAEASSHRREVSSPYLSGRV